VSGAAGAGSAASGANGARGPATDSQGVTVTDARGNMPPYDTYGAGQPQSAAQPPPSAQPYHPPQAYPSPGGGPAQAGPQGKQGAFVTSGHTVAGGATGGTGPAAAPAAGGTADGTAAVRLPRTGARTTPRTRKARLRVSKADPWSVMKVSFLLSIALGVCTVIAVAVLWMVMDAMGVFSTVGGTISEATGSNESNGFDLQSFLSLPRVLIFTSVIAVIDVVLATALATLGAFIYNISAGFVGGVELTLAEDE
jgi:hypothetical protein